MPIASGSKNTTSRVASRSGGKDGDEWRQIYGSLRYQYPMLPLFETRQGSNIGSEKDDEFYEWQIVRQENCNKTFVLHTN
ncbi:hypothetical protein E2C01_050777 [Portunus trituberculatus]|uniref:Uncharacterized protein n=1 Tax=Portunus trituberculatus TaxID=210409 RepID=A0A5B7G9V6_PORTR|nr:hypothetical protein [Portunus trituberculatus]